MKILIADDSPPTRIALSSLVEKWGAEVETAENGLEAWIKISGPEPPRVAILDWMMPKLDGVQISKRLRERGGSPFIYVILLTSKSETGDLVYALDNGAHDFLSKPVHPQELRSRIDVGKRLVEADDKLLDYATNMEKLAEERARQLVHADRLATLGTLSASVAHEIKNPLSCISGNTDLFQLYWKGILRALKGEEMDAKSQELVDESIKDFPDMMGDMKSAVIRMTEILNELTSFSRKGSRGQAKTNVHDCVEASLRLCRKLLQGRVRIEKNFMDSPPEIMADKQKIEQVFINLLTNAADALEDMKGGTVTISTTSTEYRLNIKVQDNGPGFPADKLEQIWTPFYTTKPEEKGTGLGLAIVKGIINEHGGNIRAENAPEGGACFTIDIPIVKV